MNRFQGLAASFAVIGLLVVALAMGVWSARGVVASRLASEDGQRISLVLVDAAVTDQDKLIAPLLGRKDLVIEKFRAGDGSLSELIAIGAKYHDLASIHLLSHGEPGVLQLSTQNLDAKSLTPARAALAALGKSLAPDGEVFLYGCDIGAGQDGKLLVDQLAEILGHPVAASTNPTGAARLGGDWILERQSAPMKMAALSLPQWNGVLAQNNTGVWTLGTNVGSNTVTVGSNTVTATITLGSFSTPTTSATLTQETFNTIPVFTPDVGGAPSFGIVYTWDSTPESGTSLASDDSGTEVMTITFSAPVKDPILHIDRIGGSDGTSQTSMDLTLQTPGVTLTRLSGTPHFSVAGNVITNSELGQPLGTGYTFESSTDPTKGTASGSVKLNGTFTTVSFLFSPAPGATEGAGGDAIEVGLTYDPLPVANPDTLSGYVNTTLAANLLNDNGAGADSDFNTDALTISQINGAAFSVGTPIALANGSLTVTNDATGDISFVPAANFTGTQTFTYTITDANGGTSTTSVTMNFAQTTLALSNTSQGGVGGFTFTGNNGWSSQTITTTASGTAVTGPTQTLTSPATATTISETVPPGYVVTAITCSGLGSGTATPNLGAGSVVLDAQATASGNNISCNFTDTKTATAKFQVTSVGGFGGPFGFSSPSNLASAPASITTSAVNTPTPATPSAIAITNLGTQVQVTEAPAAGYAVTGVSCTDANSAITNNSGTYGTLAGNVLTIPAAQIVAGADFTCLFTDAKTPTLKLQELTLGGFGGPFNFGQTNLTAAPASITTAAEGSATPASPSAVNVAVIGTDVTVTQTPPAGYAITAASCTDANQGITGNPTSFGAFSGAVLTVPATNVLAGADITCVLTSTHPRVALQKTTLGAAAGPFSFTVTNLASTPAAITTAAANTPTPASATPINVTTADTAVTITEAAFGGYFASGATCTDANAAITGNPASFGALAGSTLTLPAVNVKAGADITCVLSNTKGVPSLSMVKTASPSGSVAVGQTVTYTYKVTNTGNVPITNISVNDTHNGTGTFIGPANETLTTDAGTIGDSTDTTSNDGVWSVIGPGDTVTFTATYVVTQHDVDYLQ